MMAIGHSDLKSVICLFLFCFVLVNFKTKTKILNSDLSISFEFLIDNNKFYHLKAYKKKLDLEIYFFPI